MHSEFRNEVCLAQDLCIRFNSNILSFSALSSLAWWLVGGKGGCHCFFISLPLVFPSLPPQLAGQFLTCLGQESGEGEKVKREEGSRVAWWLRKLALPSAGVAACQSSLDLPGHFQAGLCSALPFFLYPRLMRLEHSWESTAAGHSQHATCFC